MGLIRGLTAASTAESQQSQNHNMEFIGTFLAQSKLSASNITNQSPPQDVEAENNDMLRLHLNLSKSLNKSTKKTGEKMSILYVTIITTVSRIFP